MAHTWCSQSLWIHNLLSACHDCLGENIDQHLQNCFPGIMECVAGEPVFLISVIHCWCHAATSGCTGSRVEAE